MTHLGRSCPGPVHEGGNARCNARRDEPPWERRQARIDERVLGVRLYILVCQPPEVHPFQILLRLQCTTL